MGTNFFWFYDILLAAIIIGVTFKSFKKGAVAVIISTVSIIAAFILAFFGSGTISDAIYEKYIAQPLTDYIDSSVSEVLGDNTNTELSKIDMGKAVVGGKFLSTIEPEFDSTGKAVLDLSDIDLTETGMSEADLTIFGIGDDFDYSLVKIGSVEVTRSELNRRSLNEIVLAHILAANVRSGSLYGTLEEIGAKITEAIPLVFGNYANEVSTGDSDIIYGLILSITDISCGNHGTAVLTNIVDPIVRVPVRIIIFILIFILVTVIMNIIANASKIINRIPVVASVNEALGGLLGLIKAVLIVLLVCIGIQFLVSLTDNELVFLNTYTIDRTFLFKYIYHFDFIDFFNLYI